MQEVFCYYVSDMGICCRNPCVAFLWLTASSLQTHLCDLLSLNVNLNVVKNVLFHTSVETVMVLSAQFYEAVGLIYDFHAIAIIHQVNTGSTAEI